MTKSHPPYTLLSNLLGDDRVQVVDVGARSGLHGRWLAFAPLIDAYGFEPDPEECARLNDSARRSPCPIRYIPSAVGRNDGQKAKLNLCRAPGCSSLYDPNMTFCSEFPFGPNMEVVGKHELVLTTLEKACRDHGIRPNVLKIDVQGAELDALNGAGTLLDSALTVELEVEFAQQYRGQPLFHEVDSFMRLHGFHLMGLRRSFWRRTQPAGWPTSSRGGQLVHGDVLYVGGALLDYQKDRMSPNDLLKALIALSAYSQDDLVVYLLSKPHPSLAALALETRRELAKLLIVPNRPMATVVSSFISGRFPNRQLRRLVDQLRSATATDWHDPDFF